MDHQITPVTLAVGLRDAFLRYFDTAFWINDESVMRERRTLLEQPGALVGQIMLEPVIPYASTERMLDVTARVGISERVARDVGKAVFPNVSPEDLKLREHQGRAIAHHFQSGDTPGAMSSSRRVPVQVRPRLSFAAAAAPGGRGIDLARPT